VRLARPEGVVGDEVVEHVAQVAGHAALAGDAGDQQVRARADPRHGARRAVLVEAGSAHVARDTTPVRTRPLTIRSIAATVTRRRRPVRRPRG